MRNADLRSWHAELTAATALVKREQETRIRALIDRFAEWTRAGYPSSSMPDSVSRSSEPGLPLPDLVDQRIRHDRERVAQIVEQHARETAEVDRICNFWLIAVPAVPVPVVVPCANPACSDGFLELGRLRGECVRCRVWRTRHGGRQYPEQMIPGARVRSENT